MSFTLTELPPRPQAPLEQPSFARWRSTAGDLVATMHRKGDGYVARFVERADFVISLADRTVVCAAVPDMTGATVRDLYLNQVLPMIRGQQGELAIHASAVAVRGGAIGFVASSGSGKSTLAAAFARAGSPFLSDDGLFLTHAEGGYLAHPNRPSFRLWQDSEAAIGGTANIPDENDDEKSQVGAGETLPFQSDPLPLRALYFLGSAESAGPAIAPLPRRAALAELINHSFLLDMADRKLLQRHFDMLADLAEAVPSFSLDYPRDYALLPEVVETVMSHDAMRETVL